MLNILIKDIKYLLTSLYLFSDEMMERITKYLHFGYFSSYYFSKIRSYKLGFETEKLWKRLEFVSYGFGSMIFLKTNYFPQLH